MTLRGSGSFSSPIVISDDEDEAIVESQLRVASNSSSPSGADDCKEVSPPSLSPPLDGPSAAHDLHVSPNIAQSVGYSMALRMGFRPGHGLGFELDGKSPHLRLLSLTRSCIGQVEPVSAALKRKRTNSGIGFCNHSEDSESRFQTDPTNDERKKLKPNQPFGQSQKTKIHRPTSAKGKEKPTVVESPPLQEEFQATLSPSHTMLHDSGPSESAQETTHGFPVEPSLLLQHHLLDPFAMYHYMAPGLQEMWPLPWMSFATPPRDSWTGSLPYFSEAANVGIPSNIESVKQPQVTKDNRAPPPPQPIVPPKNSTKNGTSIGRGSEDDPHGTHGIYPKFMMPPPNPSCTLVLDGIPSRFRSFPWLETWAANAGQLPAVRVDVTSKGKGFVEFPDEVTAQKAFNSKQLRGKGKNSIKAWWYRPLATASRAVLTNGAGELEEGEIPETPASEAVECTGTALKLLTRKQKKKQKNLDSQRLNQPSGAVAGAISKECESPPTVQPTDTAPPPSPHTAPESSATSLTLSSTTIVASPSPDRGDLDDIVMTSPPHPPSPVPPPVEQHVTQNSTNLQCGIITPPSTVDNVLPDVNGVSPSPIPLQTLEAQHIQAPSRIPSEPRGFRSPPVGPSFTKRSLLARQKELEDRINQSKLALEKMHKPPSSTSIPSALVSFSPTPTPHTEGVSDDKLSMEQNLRRLVLESKKDRAKPPNTSADSDNPPPKPLTSNDNISTPPYSTVSTSAAFVPITLRLSDDPSDFYSSLDQLAVSFITESIETAKQQPTNKVAVAPSSSREELALKHQRLERYITESKMLMAELSKASTREEREAILSAMRECSRYVLSIGPAMC